MKEAGLPNLYDCAVCRASGHNRTLRVCLLDLPRATVEVSGLKVSVDRESILYHVDDTPDPIRAFARVRGERPEVCYVPALSMDPGTLMLEEWDAKEYGLPAPVSLRKLAAFRVIRSERARVDQRRMKMHEARRGK